MTAGIDKSLVYRHWVLLGLFAAVVALLGGASRYDVVQIVPLRAIAALFLIPAILFITLSDLRREAVLCGCFLVFTVLIALQLIPLPPQIWQSLPKRDVIAQMDTILGLDDAWRPLTMAPMRTWNALGSLVVPGVALLLVLALRPRSRVLLQIIAAIGVFHAVLGLFQVVTGENSPLYLYSLTNRGSAVGLLANENHSGIFSAISLLVVSRLGILALDDRRKTIWPLIYSAAFMLIFTAALVGKSRAGLSASLGATIIALAMVWMSRLVDPNHRRGMLRQKMPDWLRKVTLFVPVIVLGLTIMAFIAFGRSPAFQDIVTVDTVADMRWKLLPVELEMLQTFWLFGAGLGSFEQVYKIFEPAALLNPFYVNQAHNDWLQLLIEGGVVAGILLFVLVLHVVHLIVRLSKRKESWVVGIFWISLLAIIAAASVIDYPLRTPLFQLILVWSLLALSYDARGVKDTAS